MNFLLDENFPKAIRAVLEAEDHQVFDYRDIGKPGSPDDDVVMAAMERKAVILTTDRDFFHTLGRKYPGHHGIIVVALRKPTRSAILERLRWFLKSEIMGDLQGRSFQLRDRTWVVHPPMQPTDPTSPPETDQR